MRWVITVWLVAIAALLWLAYPDVEALTLDDPGNWTPSATLDTSQVEAPVEIPEHCVAVYVDTMPDEAVRDLLYVGWFSDPTDGGEILYSPECIVVTP